MEKLEEREAFVLTNNNQKIFGIFHRPIGVVNPPVVLFFHGMGGHKTGRYRVYIDLAEKLIQEKIAVMRFDFRGSGDSEGRFEEMSLQDQLSDAMLAVDHLLSIPGIDINRIGFFGRSLGASLALLCASEFQNVKSLALWAPLFDGKQWEQQWQKLLAGGMTEEESREARRINGQVASVNFYSEMFSMPIIEAIKRLKKVPMLFIHGEQDRIITIEHSEDYVRERKSANAETVFIRLPNGDHDFTHTEERLSAIATTAQWFKKTL